MFTEKNPFDMKFFARLSPDRKTVSQINAYFRENPRWVNDFDADELNFSDASLSLLHKIFSKESGYTLFHDVFVPQRHNVSVESHVDSGVLGTSQYFFLWVADTKLKTKTRFNKNAYFRYFDLDGKKHEHALCKGDLIVFNQNKPHELLYRGEEVTLMLGTIKKRARCSKKVKPSALI